MQKYLPVSMQVLLDYCENTLQQGLREGFVHSYETLRFILILIMKRNKIACVGWKVLLKLRVSSCAQ